MSSGRRWGTSVSWLPALAAVCLSACNSGAPSMPSSEIKTITPPAPQVLAYATDREVGVIEPDGPRVLGRIPARRRLDALVWSADGQHLAWRIASDSSHDLLPSIVRLVDVRTGTSAEWKGIDGELSPSVEGLTVGGIPNGFHELSPDGTTRAYSMKVPVRPRSREAREEDAAAALPPIVSFAIPRAGDWLIAADDRSHALAGQSYPKLLDSYRLDDASLETQGATRAMTVERAVRIDDTQVAWVTSRLEECFLGSEVEALGTRVPSLPPVPGGGGWEIRRLIAARSGLQVVVRAIPDTVPKGSHQICPDEGHGQLAWYALRDGRWELMGRDLEDVAVADDGRVVRVPATPAGLSSTTGLPSFHYGTATLSERGGAVQQVPRNTRSVVFSPAVPVWTRVSAGTGPALDQRSSLVPDGVGPLRLGADIPALQGSTRTPLTFKLRDGCGRLRPTDRRLDHKLGVRGLIVDGRLKEVRITSRDAPLGEDDYPLQDLEPKVKKVSPRGPRTWRGFQVGMDLNHLVLAHGLPAARETTSRQGAVDYTYRSGESTLVAHADAAAIVRRLELFRGEAPPSCSPGAQGPGGRQARLYTGRGPATRIHCCGLRKR